VACRPEDGAVQRRLNRRGLRPAGLAYWADDPDGYGLYIFHSAGGDTQMVYKMHPVSGDTIRVAELWPEGGGSPVGSYITSEYDVYSVVFMGISDASVDAGGDRIDVWQVEANRGWMTIEPDSGMIPAGEWTSFRLLLDSGGLPDTLFAGSLVWVHDGVGGETSVPVLLHVMSGPQPPSAFNLLTPGDGDTLRGGEVGFTWEASVDPNPEDEVSYLLWLSSGADSVSIASVEPGVGVSLDTLALEVDLDAPMVWWVWALSGDDTVESVQRFSLWNEYDSAVNGPLTPLSFGIESVQPNPFNGVSVVRFGLNRGGEASLAVYDVQGRLVQRLLAGELGMGRWSIPWDGRGLSSGIYLLVLKSGARTDGLRAVLMK